jgi:hypothetical protein
MTDLPRFRKKTTREENDYRSPARWVAKPEPGQDFTTLTANHGRPYGPFERGRQKPYGAHKDEPS